MPGLIGQPIPLFRKFFVSRKRRALAILAGASVVVLAIAVPSLYKSRTALSNALCRSFEPRSVPSQRLAASGAISRPIELLSAGWHELSSIGSGWPEAMRIRSLRGLAVHDGSIFVGPRSEHGPCGARYGQLLEYRNGRWRISGGTADTTPWPDNRVDRVNQIRVLDGRVHAALGAQYSEIGAASVVVKEGDTWRDISRGNAPFSQHSASMALATYRGSVAVGLVSPGYRPPTVALLRGNTWQELLGSRFAPCKYSFIFALTEFKGSLYMGALDGNDHCMGGVWRWTGNDWEHVAGKGQFESWVHADSNRSVSGVNGFRVDPNLGLIASVSQGMGGAIHPVWRFDGASWRPIAPNPPPIWREESFFDFVAIVDGRVVVGGGGEETGGGPKLWQQSDDTWVQLAGGGIDGSWTAAPVGSDHRFVYELETAPFGYVVVFGGSRPGDGRVWLYKRESAPESRASR